MILPAAGSLFSVEHLSIWQQVALFLMLFGLSFFFSGTETAFFSLQAVDRRRIEESDAPEDKRIASYLKDRPALITTILMGNETVNVAIATTAGALAALALSGQEWLPPEIIPILVVTPTLVLFSEITPKVLAFRYSSSWVRIAVLPLSVIYYVLFIPRVIVGAAVSGLARIFGVNHQGRQESMGEQEFLVLVEQGAEQGVVDETEREIIEAVFELDDMPVSRVMTPKPDMFTLPLDSSYEELLEACREHRYSRIPLFDEDVENIVGVMLLKDLLRVHRRGFNSAREVKDRLLTPVFVPTTKRADEMMREMIKDRLHMAFVVDEYGSLSGLVTLDDLIAELVGDLGDEQREESATFERNEEGLSVNASMDVEDFYEETGIELPGGDYHTLGGFVFAELGRLATVGDTFIAQGHKFEVMSMEGRRVTQLKVISVASSTEEVAE